MNEYGSLVITREHNGDEKAISSLHESAFGQPDEALLVDHLREQGAIFLSLVAWLRDELVGNVVFSGGMVRGDRGEWSAIALGPLAVMPHHQKRGIGTALVEAGLMRCRQAGVGAVFVLGDPAYYARFGFIPAWSSHIRWEQLEPRDEFQVVELLPGGIQSSGVFAYHSAFNDLT